MSEGESIDSKRDRSRIPELHTTIKVFGPEGNEAYYTREALTQKIDEVRQQVLTELYGPLIPEKSSRLFELVRESLDSRPMKDIEVGFEGEKEQWLHVAVPLSPDSYLAATISRAYREEEYEVGDDVGNGETLSITVSANENRYCSDCRVQVYRRTDDMDNLIRSKDVLFILLEEVESGTDLRPYPEIQIGEPCMVDGQRVSPYDYFHQRVGQTVGREAVSFLNQIASGSSPLERAREAAINLLIFGTEDAPLQLFPSISGGSFIGMTRELRQIDEWMVDHLIKLLEEKEFDGERFLGKKEAEYRRLIKEGKPLPVKKKH